MTTEARSVARDLLGRVPQGPLEIWWGVVTAVVAGPPKSVTVNIGGDTTAVAGVRYHHLYAPAVNDVCFGIRALGDPIALGKLA